MPYEINLIDRDNRYAKSYLSLIEKIEQHFSSFERLPHDADFFADEVFVDDSYVNKYTKQEIIEKGLGVKLKAKLLKDWIEISFWDDSFVSIDLPNYPQQGIDEIIASIIRIINFLYREGLVIEHPIEDKVIPQEEVKVFLCRAYVKRQALVNQVAKIVSQKSSESSD